MNDQGHYKGIWTFIGGTVFAGVLGILGFLIGVIQLGQTERDANNSNSVNATIVVIQEEQLSALKEIATLQATGDTRNDAIVLPNLTLEANLDRLMVTVNALEEEKNAVEATGVAYDGEWTSANMSEGLSGPSTGNGIWFGAYKYLTFTEAEKYATLDVVVRSNGHLLRIELWNGRIAPNDHYWWNTHPQEAVSIGSGPSPEVELDPELVWQIQPGEYTLFFAGFNASGVEENYSIEYKISTQP